jgi:hypothetical protein
VLVFLASRPGPNGEHPMAPAESVKFSRQPGVCEGTLNELAAPAVSATDQSS